MSTKHETIKYRNHTIDIYYDEDPADPRGWDNMTEFHCWRKRYNLGDVQHNSTESVEDMLAEAKGNGDIVFPLYIYDHSGITVSMGRVYPYNCPWDSGQVGFIVVRRSKLLKEYSKKRLTKALREKASYWANIEVDTYDKYLRGECFGYVNDDYDGDSCWGYYEVDFAISEAKSAIDWQIKKDKQTHFDMLKTWIRNRVPLQYRDSFNDTVLL